MNGQTARAGLASALLALLGLCAGGIGIAAAQDATRSVYTTIDLKTCKPEPAAQPGTAWRCPGLPAYPILVTERDDHHYVSAGLDPEKRQAAKQTLKPANTIFPGGATRATVEWRIPRTSRKAAPYAMIIRYTTSSETARSQVLVVSKVTPTETCLAALIDATANADANERARVAADATQTFDCKNAPSLDGVPGKIPL
jgi:hypothetical protein